MPEETWITDISTSEIFLILNLGLSSYMAGVIWIIQLIHYPAFEQIPEIDFHQFHKRHSQVMTLLVGPVMILELIVAVLWVFAPNPEPDSKLLWINLLMVCLLWGLTFLVSVPIHHKLESGKDLKGIQKLVKTNWPRTVLWTLKVFLAGSLFF